MAATMLKDRDGLPMPEGADFVRLVQEAERTFRPTRRQWTSLMMELLWAEEIRKKGIEADNAPSGTTVPRLVLAAMLRFLLDQRSIMEHGAATSLLDLQAALAGLGDGFASPMFKPE
jgi:hypothetical protein